MKTKLLTICLFLISSQAFANRYLPHPSDPSLGETFMIFIVFCVFVVIVSFFLNIFKWIRQKIITKSLLITNQWRWNKEVYTGWVCPNFTIFIKSVILKAWPYQLVQNVIQIMSKKVVLVFIIVTVADVILWKKVVILQRLCCGIFRDVQLLHF